MKLLCKSLVGILLFLSLHFGSFSPTHREENDGISAEMEDQTLDQDFLAPQEDENDAYLFSDKVPEAVQTSSDSTEADKATSDDVRELLSEKHPKMEKRQPFDFGGSSRSGKRASSPREKHSQIDKREPFDYGGHSRTGKRTSGHGNVVSQDEADENIEKAELLQQSPEQLQEAINSLLKRYKEKTVGLNSRTALRTLEDVAMELKREDEALEDSHSLDDDNKGTDGRNPFDDQVDETTKKDHQDSQGTKRGNKVPVPGFLGSIKGFDSRLEPLGNLMEPQDE